MQPNTVPSHLFSNSIPSPPSGQSTSAKHFIKTCQPQYRPHTHTHRPASDSDEQTLLTHASHKHFLCRQQCNSAQSYPFRVQATVQSQTYSHPLCMQATVSLSHMHLQCKVKSSHTHCACRQHCMSPPETRTLHTRNSAKSFQSHLVSVQATM